MNQSFALTFSGFVIIALGAMIFVLLRIIQIKNMQMQIRDLCDDYNEHNLIAPKYHPQSAYQWFCPQLPSVRTMFWSPRKVDLRSWSEPALLKKLLAGQPPEEES